MKKIISLFAISLLFLSCSKNQNSSDAYGNFEINDVIISSQASGELLEFAINEGETLVENQVVGLVDTTILSIKKDQVMNNIEAMTSKIESAKLSFKALNRQKELIETEKNRVADLFKKEAATEQNRDKIFSEYDVIVFKVNALEKDIQSLEKQKDGLYNSLAEINETIAKAKVVNPITGVVLGKYKEAFEIVGAGMPLYKIGNLDEMFLKIYISADQLDDIKIGQQVEVLIDKDRVSNHKLSGKISWISSTSEFTPKNIQTKEERIDQVYAVKVLVKNDGRIKIGMPGEVNF